MTATRIPLEMIHPSPSNPRKTFDPAALQELATSIVEHGVVQPIKVRPHPTLNHGSYELVIGERRWRASKLAKVTDIPAIVEDLTETQVLEQQLVENTQRVDVHPLEEADGYQQLLDHHGYTMESLVEKTGRSRAHLYGRLKLLELAPGPRKAFITGKIGAAIAEAIARIHAPKLQEEALTDVLGQGRWGDYEQAGVDPGAIAPNDGQLPSEAPKFEPLSFRAAQALIRRKYHLKLAEAKFPTGDPRLVEGVGACGPCEFRSGNQPELPGIGNTPGDLCTKPSCFEAKTKAHWDVQASSAKSAGMVVLNRKEALGCFEADGITLKRTSAYVDPDEPLPSDLAMPGSRATWKSLLGKRLRTDEAPTVLIQDERGAARELLDKAAAVKVLRELGKIDKPDRPPAPAKSATAVADYKKQQEKDRAKRELTEAAIHRVMAQVVDGAGEALDKKELPVWRWLARNVVATVNYGDADMVGERRGLDNFDALEGVIEKAKTVRELLGVMAEIFICVDAQAAKLERFAGSTAKASKERLEIGLKLFGGDWDKAVDAAKASAKAEAQIEKTKDAKKPKKGGK